MLWIGLPAPLVNGYTGKLAIPFQIAANSFQFFRDCLYILFLIQRINFEMSEQIVTPLSMIQVFNQKKEYSQIQAS